jgi:cytochrome bd-type quinol oxidase subunit 2
MNQRDQSDSADTRQNPVRVLKGLLSRLMILGGVVLTGVFVTTGLSLILKAAGDDAGASAVQWLAWVASGCFGIILVVLLVAVTLAVLQLMDRAFGSEEPGRPAAFSTPQQSPDTTTE